MCQTGCGGLFSAPGACRRARAARRRMSARCGAVSAVHALDDRLRTVAAMVRPGALLADVGSDHAALICALALDGVIPGGIASDIHPKPLARARREIARNGLGCRIVCRLGDGLAAMEKDEVEDIVLAGMGGELIAKILGDCSWDNLSEKRFLLQPMTRAPFLRRWLYANGFEILTERACCASGRPYTVMQAGYTGMRSSLGEYDLYCYAGELTCDSSPEARAFLRRTASSLLTRERGIAPRDPDGAARLRCLTNKLLTVIEEE
jgi:tRNA (adenine22-N1)-methyltransferase